jgi:hypothetical protein
MKERGKSLELIEMKKAIKEEWLISFDLDLISKFYDLIFNW